MNFEFAFSALPKVKYSFKESSAFNNFFNLSIDAIDFVPTLSTVILL